MSDSGLHGALGESTLGGFQFEPEAQRGRSTV
jgi:hypothetical protein